MRVVQLLLALLARCSQVVAAHRHHVVAAVRRRVVDGLVLAHEEEGDRGRDTAEGSRVCADVDMMPGAGIGETGLGPCQYGLYRIMFVVVGTAFPHTFPTVCDMMQTRFNRYTISSPGSQTACSSRRPQHGLVGMLRRIEV